MNGIVPNNLFNRLPEYARETLSRLIAQREDALSLMRSDYVASVDLRRTVVHLQQQRDLLERRRPVRTRLNANANGARAMDAIEHRPLMVETRIDETVVSKEIVDVDSQLKPLLDQQKRAEDRKIINEATTQRLTGLITSIATWLGDLPATMAIDEIPRGQGVRKSTDVTPEAIERRRFRIRELLADIRQTDAAPCPNSEAKRLARAEVERLAELGRPNVDPLIERRENIIWPEQSVRVMSDWIDPMVRDGVALVAWLHRDALIAALDKEIDESAEDGGLSDVERAARFKTQLSDLLTAERDEEMMIAAANFDVDRRPDADPRAVLRLVSSLPGPKRADFFHRALAGC